MKEMQDKDANTPGERCAGFPLLREEIKSHFGGLSEDVKGVHWKWRYAMAEYLASSSFFANKNVKAIYILGSVKNAESGPASDIDLIVHDAGGESCREELQKYFSCWAQCLSELNFGMTGESVDEMLDVHFASDSDMENRNSFTSMIGSHVNSARLLKKFED